VSVCSKCEPVDRAGVPFAVPSINPGLDPPAYPDTTQQVKQLVQAAYATADDPSTGENEQAAAIAAAKDQLAAANELGCPLGGTSAIPVQ
jgi:hypothetical protein